MDVSTDELSAFLNLAWANAGAGANTLPDQLLAEQQKALGFIAMGSLSSVAKNSASQSLGGYNPGNLTQRQITNIFSILIRTEKNVREAIVNAAAKANPVVVIPADFDLDGDVKAQMENFLQLATQATSIPDIRDLRIPLFRGCGQNNGVCA